MKYIYLSFIVGAIVLVSFASCVNKPSSDGGEEGPLAGFSWKTTKSVPLNIVSETAEPTAVFIYDDSKMIAAGYTPFQENVVVPSSCTELSVSTFPMPYNVLFPSHPINKSDVNSLMPTKISVQTSVTQTKVTSPSYIDLHEYLYMQWAGWKQGGFTWDYFVTGFWNTSGGPQGQSSITLYTEHPPVYNSDGSIASIYHTCGFEGCSGNSGSVPDADVTTPQAGTYLFEDLFPSMGDYDMNDFVVEESSSTIVSKGNKIVATELSYKINASGSGVPIAMAVYMPYAKTSDIDDIEMFIVNANGTETPYECLNISGMFEFHPRTNLEKSNANEVVIPIFDNVKGLLSGASGNTYFNTSLTGFVADPINVKVRVNFKNKNISISDFKTDVFIMPKNDRSHEIHVVDAKYTDHMDKTLFGTSDDASSGSKTFRAKNGYVWGIYIPTVNFRHPIEKVHLDKAYPDFGKWVSSFGTTNTDWYEKPVSGNVWTW